MQVKLLVVEEHVIVRNGIGMLFENQKDVFIVGETSTITDVLHFVLTLQPDVVLIDIDLPDPSGINTIVEIKANRPETSIVVLTFHDDHIYKETLFSIGVDAVVSKRAASHELVNTIRSMAQLTPA